jgi:phage-related baseplate assembly protein
MKDPTKGNLPDFDGTDESNAAVKVLEVAAYRELLLRQNFDERALALFLAYATGTDLDQLAARFNMTRLTDETDAAFKIRILLAPTAFSVAGPAAAYRYFALGALSTIADASVTTPQPDDIKALVDATLAALGVSADNRTAMRAALDGATWPGTVLISLLSSQGDGTASAAEIAAVEAAVATSANVRPLTDHVVVQSAEIVPYAIEGPLTMFDGPDSSVVLAAANAGATTFAANARRIGRDINLASIFAAIGGANAGISNAKLTSLPADLVISDTQASYCTNIALTDGGRGNSLLPQCHAAGNGAGRCHCGAYRRGAGAAQDAAIGLDGAGRRAALAGLEMAVYRWDSSWSEARKRDAIGNAIFDHRRRGTRGAMDALLAEYDQTLTLLEWWEPGGRPALYLLGHPADQRGRCVQQHGEFRHQPDRRHQPHEERAQPVSIPPAVERHRQPADQCRGAHDDDDAQPGADRAARSGRSAQPHHRIWRAAGRRRRPCLGVCLNDRLYPHADPGGACRHRQCAGGHHRPCRDQRDRSDRRAIHRGEHAGSAAR